MEIPHRAMLGAWRALQGEQGDAGGDRLLAWLGWLPPAPADRTADRAALLRIGLLCRRVFGLMLPAAPGLCAIGAEIDPGVAGLPRLGASGVGLDPGAAFAGCMGEAAERLAQIEMPGDVTEPGDGTAPQVALRRWPDGAAVPWPADLVFRRRAPRLPPPAPLSIGCAAGPGAAQARLSALLEVVERDAVALWWRGGARPARIAPHSPAGAAAADACARLFQPGGAATDLLLDLSGDAGVPVVAAIRFGGPGDGFLCGTAARPGLAAAAQAAVLEMAQNELAVTLAAAKRAAGTALTARDEAHLRRHAAMRAADIPAGPARPDRRDLGDDPAGCFATIADRLAGQGHAVLEHDHARARLGVAVHRVIVPGLACEPSRDVAPRLAAAIGATGGGPGLRANVSLFA